MSRPEALIVDDSATARIVLSRLLAKADFDSRGVGSAEDALKALQSGTQPDVIFLDHMLPGMNGFEALREIKRNPDSAAIPVFMYTSQNAERYLEEARALGALGVISKQTNRDQLALCLSRVQVGRGSANSDIGPVAENVHVAYHQGDEQRSVRHMTGRLSQLEVAYEDMHDDVRALRLALHTQVPEQVASLQRSLRRTRWLLAGALFVGAAGFLSLWGEMESTREVAEGIRHQFMVVTDILYQMLELTGHPVERDD